MNAEHDVLEVGVQMILMVERGITETETLLNSLSKVDRELFRCFVKENAVEIGNTRKDRFEQKLGTRENAAFRKTEKRNPSDDSLAGD